MLLDNAEHKIEIEIYKTKFYREHLVLVRISPIYAGVESIALTGSSLKYLKVSYFCGENFRGNLFSRMTSLSWKISRELIFENFANGSFSKKFARMARFFLNSREENFANGTFFQNFAGRKFREIRGFSLFRENKFLRKFVPVKISHRENMRL